MHLQSRLLLLLLATASVLTPTVASTTAEQNAVVKANVGTAGEDVNSDRVYLLSVPSLTFVAEARTTGHRNPSKLQLECTGGAAGGETAKRPLRVDCYNVGVANTLRKEGEEPLPKWKCVGVMSHDVRISHWVVHCEGYSYPGDAFVLKDSCRLEYQLEYAKPVQGDAVVAGAAEGDVLGGKKGERRGVVGMFFTSVWNILLFLVAALCAAYCLGLVGRARENSESDVYTPLSQTSHEGYSSASR